MFGFLLLAGNLGGMVLVLIIQAAIGNPYLSFGALSVACLAGLALANRLPARGGSHTLRGILMTDPMADLERRLKPYRDQFPSFRELPTDGLARTEVTGLVERLASADERTWRDGYVSGPSTTAIRNTLRSSAGSTPRSRTATRSIRT